MPRLAVLRAHLVETRVDRLFARELALLEKLNGARLPRSLVGVLRLASRLGDGVFWYALMAVMLLRDGVAAAPAVAHMIAAGLVGTALYKWLKAATERPRPYQACASIACLTAPLDRFSFPSGHTLHAVIFSVLACAYWPALAWIVWPFTALVGLSRLVLGLHYPTDVVVGALLGCAVAALALGV